MSDDKGSSMTLPIIMIAVIAIVLFTTLSGNKKEPTTTDQSSGTGTAYTPNTLKIAVLPDENPSKLAADNAKLVDYLTKETGMKVELVPMVSYEALTAAMVTKKLDVAYFGPLTYCIAREKTKGGIECFAAKLKNGQPTYHSIVIANSASGIEKLSDIKGKTMAYGSAGSTSSHLIPKSILVEKGGLKVEKGNPLEYKQEFLGKHDAVAISVQNGHCQAGGLSQPIFEGMVKDGKIDLTKVKIIATSEPFPQYPWAYQASLNPELKAKIKKAFLALNKNDHAEILKPLKAGGFAEMKDETYDVVRNLSPLVGLTLNEINNLN